ncbi:hypothetical protein CASFOL_018028 [Castilleja foliolosa]|uniref:Phytocyanin domain-containing protein n=1 Tax=Castilleja foliolosa TaxID=1961234 RepID=A0ABD3D771_9LAMI
MCSSVVVMVIVSVALVFQSDVAQSINIKPLTTLSRKPVTYRVGNIDGWDKSHSLGVWPNDKTFYVGDKLFFQYDYLEHNVYMVNEKGYNSCKINKGSRLWTSGNDVITLGKKGWHYFICDYPGNCENGMKIKVNVL